MNNIWTKQMDASLIELQQTKIEELKEQIKQHQEVITQFFSIIYDMRTQNQQINHAYLELLKTVNDQATQSEMGDTTEQLAQRLANIMLT